ncbi:putative transporter [Venturia nashicola]|nr:putative transporter [Venturia nashicola]
MPGLIRKILICAAADGLILQPISSRANIKATDQSSIKLDYKSHAISPLLKDRRQEDATSSTIEVHGVVGLLQVASSAFLVSISRRELVAQIRGKPIYTIAEVVLIPLSSQVEAEKAIARARDSQTRHNAAKEQESDTIGISEDEGDDTSLTEDNSVASEPSAGPTPATTKDKQHQRDTSVAQDVMTRKGFYGRFTNKWFSKGGWTADNRRTEGLTSEEDLSKTPEHERGESAPVGGEDALAKVASKEAQGPNELDGAELSNEAPPEVADVRPPSGEEVPLLPKLLTVAKFFFGSKSFYFSYDYDLSRNISKQPASTSSVPLVKSFDQLFFWNRHLITPFADAGQNEFVTPLIQGFVGQREFSVASAAKSTSQPAEQVVSVQDHAAADTFAKPLANFDAPKNEHKRDYLLTIISRRSVKRAGLRYLRRGIDEDGNVANSVETEQILSSDYWDEDNGKVYSFLQYRGSIPLFFSQSPYSLKPIVEAKGSWDQNAAALRKHFQSLVNRYGNVQVDSLVEKRANEKTIGEAFERHVLALNEKGGIDGGKKVGFEWFDFHHVCRGMKFENVSQLFDTIGSTLSSFSWTIQQGDQVVQRQSGVLRTNCMDCLDRTNVVQSACGRNTLEQQLKDEGAEINLHTDPSTSWFNTLWADNGDAISRQYAGTAALKGDFTRTRKRNISGALTDFSLTLTRYYNNIVNDYFAQNVIDFVLGNVDEDVFIDFEADMKAHDYAVDLRKVRQSAIDTCVRICMEDADEDLAGGWTLSCPRDQDSLRSVPFEESVLLLSNKAVYFCRMDWTTEKVRAFERIELETIDGITRGSYITSTLGAREMDEKRNVGFFIKYRPGGGDLVRVNTRTLGGEASEEAKKVKDKESKAKGGSDKLIAFKALPPRSSFAGGQGNDQKPPSEIDLIKLVTGQIASAINNINDHVGDSAAGDSEPKSGKLVVEQRDIVSLAEAKKNTGYLEQLGYSLKKLVWAT